MFIKSACFKMSIPLFVAFSPFKVLVGVGYANFKLYIRKLYTFLQLVEIEKLQKILLFD